MSTIVPAHGEIMIWVYPDEDAEDGEEPFFLKQCPVVAWRVPAGEIWGEPVLPANCKLPECETCFTALLMPNGTVYDADGSERFDSAEAFADRWRRFFEVRRERQAGMGAGHDDAIAAFATAGDER
jgi:hypothetical protein